MAQFIEPPQPPGTPVEIVCSSGKLVTGKPAQTRAIRLFSHQLTLDPERFQQWPHTSELCCWWCTEQFGTTPVCIPKKRNEETAVFEVYGVFCGGPCGLAYIMRESRASDLHQIMMDYRFLLIEVFGCHPPSVFDMRPAPPREALTKFGGHLSIGEFRLAGVTADTELVEPPFVNYNMVLQDNSKLQDQQNHQIRGLRRPEHLPPTGNMNNASLFRAPSVKSSDVTGVCSNLPEGGEFAAFVQAKEAEPREDKEEAKPVQLSGMMSRFMNGEPGKRARRKRSRK